MLLVGCLTCSEILAFVPLFISNIQFFYFDLNYEYSRGGMKKDTGSRAKTWENCVYFSGFVFPASKHLGDSSCQETRGRNIGPVQNHTTWKLQCFQRVEGEFFGGFASMLSNGSST